MLLPRSFLIRTAICVTITVTVLCENAERTPVDDVKPEESRHILQSAESNHCVGGYGPHGMASYEYPRRHVSPPFSGGDAGRKYGVGGNRGSRGEIGGAVYRNAGHDGFDRRYGNIRKSSRGHIGGENHYKSGYGGNYHTDGNAGYGGKALASGRSAFTKKASGGEFGGKPAASIGFGVGFGGLGKKAVSGKKKGTGLHKKKHASIDHSLGKSHEGHKKDSSHHSSHVSGHKHKKEHYGHAHVAGKKNPYVKSDSKYDKFSKEHYGKIGVGGHVDGLENKAKYGKKGKGDVITGGKVIKDKAHKSHSFKNVYEKTEYGDHKSYKDDFEDMDFKKKHAENKDYFDLHGGKLMKVAAAKKFHDDKKHSDDYHKYGKDGFHGYKDEGHKKGGKHYDHGHNYKDSKVHHKNLKYGMGHKAHKKGHISIPVSHHHHLHG